MAESKWKSLSRNAGGLGLLAVALSAMLYNARSVFDWTAGTALVVGLVLLTLYFMFHYRELLESLRRRSTKYGLNTLATVVVVLAILGFINFLGSRHHKRFDLTTNQMFSISEQTIKVLQNLQTDVRLLYFDKAQSQPVRDLVREYQARSSHIKYEYVDAQKNRDLTSQFNVHSIPTVVLQLESNPNQKQLIPSPTEENLTNALIQLTHRKKRVVYFTEGHGEAGISGDDAQSLSLAKKGLENQGYEVKMLNLIRNKIVPEDCSVVVVAGPKYPFLPPESDAIDQFVDAGGKILILVDPETEPGLEKEFEKWNVQVDKDAVVDASGVGQILGMGPASPIVTEYENQPVVKDFNRTMTIFPLARSVRVAGEKSDFAASSLFKTSPNSWGETNLKERPLRFDKGVDLQGPLSLAVVSTKSVFPANDKPARSQEARVEVIGNSRFAGNEFFQLQRNGDLFLNSVSWLAEDQDLISIRPKNPENRRVEFSESTGRLLFWCVVIILPMIALLSGALVWSKRRKTQGA